MISELILRVDPSIAIATLLIGLGLIIAIDAWGMRCAGVPGRLLS